MYFAQIITCTTTSIRTVTNTRTTTEALLASSATPQDGREIQFTLRLVQGTRMGLRIGVKNDVVTAVQPGSVAHAAGLQVSEGTDLVPFPPLAISSLLPDDAVPALTYLSPCSPRLASSPFRATPSLLPYRSFPSSAAA